MKLEVLVSTMYQQGYDLIKKMNIQSDAVFINQCTNTNIKDISYNNLAIKWINSTERGLSNSRNMALENATGDICILSDDDLEYVSNYDNIIIEQFKLYPQADIISFQVEGIEHKFKNYYKKSKDINLITSMRISSVEVAFRLDKIRKSEIQFNNLFGAGAKYYMGEENIFLAECLRSGLKIKYVPIKIANIHVGQSTWFMGYNKEYFINKGAAFTALSDKLSLLLITQFAIRKFKLYANRFNILDVIKFMLEGRERYLEEYE